MIRILVSRGSLVAGASLPLAPEETHHLQVRRVGDATRAVALDTCGTTAEGRVIRSGKEWLFLVDDVVVVPAPAATILAVGAGDRDRFIQAVEKATELGVTRIIPLETERARQVATRLRSSSIDKTRRAALEACKQCGNPWAPVIVDPMEFDEFVTAQLSARWLLADAGGAPLPAIDRTEAIGWLIGPEGGFTPAETEALTGGLAPAVVSLGPHVLRFETAVTAAAALTAQLRAHG